jgi:DNA-binding transcriptional LysR family regulator
VATKSPDLNLLPIAFALYDELSVSRAARLLGMSQPAVSMALRRMREAFDDPLFIRVASGIAPTPRAHTIIQAARPLVTRLHEDLLRGQTFDPATSARPFTLGLSDVGEMAFLPLMWPQLRARAPRAPIRAVSVAGALLAHELEKGDLDVAVGYYPSLASKNFRQRRLSSHGFACLLRRDHPIRAERISATDYVNAEHVAVREHGRSQEVMERFFDRRRVRRKVVVYASHFLGIPKLIASSDLIATVPYAMARDFAEMSPQIAVALPPFEIPGFDLKLYWHRRFDNEPRNKWLRDQVFEVLGRDRRPTVPPK